MARSEKNTGYLILILAAIIAALYFFRKSGFTSVQMTTTTGQPIYQQCGPYGDPAFSIVKVPVNQNCPPTYNGFSLFTGPVQFPGQTPPFVGGQPLLSTNVGSPILGPGGAMTAGAGYY